MDSMIFQIFFRYCILCSYVAFRTTDSIEIIDTSTSTFCRASLYMDEFHNYYNYLFDDIIMCKLLNNKGKE